MSLPAFALALFLLLLTPGPTNTLLAVAGATSGARRSLPLIGAELAGYLTTVVPLVAFAGPFLERHPAVATAIKLGSAAWVLWLAARLWTRPPNLAAEAFVTGRRVYLTTVLNPKGLIIGLALIPPVAFLQALPFLVALSICVAGVAGLWLTLGASAIRGLGNRHPVLVGRVAAGFLAFFAVSLAGRSLGWM